MKAILTFLLLLIIDITNAQDIIPLKKMGFAPALIPDSVQVDFGIAEHLWIDGNYYQFAVVSVTGLPAINPAHDSKTNDSIEESNLKSLSNQDFLVGGYDFANIVSKDQTFNPIKTIVEVIYDSISKKYKENLTSLFLLDDFDKIEKGETLLLYSRGCFGYLRQSRADCDEFIADVRFDKSLFDGKFSYPIASQSWYKEWLKSAPKDYRSPREANRFGEKNKSFEDYFERIKTGPTKNKQH